MFKMGKEAVVDSSMCVMLPSGVCRDLMNQRRSFSYSGDQKIIDFCFYS